MSNAYLIIREGSKWADVFRLVPGESATIGRGPTNAIVIKDERCSRNHAEVFQAGGQWLLRDLDSRNGTMVSGDRIASDRQLEPGDIIQIGNSHLAFVENLAQAFPDDSSTLLKTSRPVDGAGTGISLPAEPDDDSVFEAFEPTLITHRKGQSRYLEAPELDVVDSS
ncbi:MAG TPA: FHA domain-containing protein, partial [Lacipirellula sp.]